MRGRVKINNKVKEGIGRKDEMGKGKIKKEKEERRKVKI